MNLLSCPRWVPDTTVYLTLMGSVAYGVSSDCSDSDVYGFCIPPKEVIFPHLTGEILGFGREKKRFENWQQHHILHEDKNYDFSIYNIVKYFSLCMECNPNMIDSLFTPLNCIIHSTQVGNLVRENRKIFLHKGAKHKFSGYANSMLHKMKNKTPIEGSKRDQDIKKNGFDTKYAYHLCRLLDECEQILSLHDIDLQRSNEFLKAIRRGEVEEERIYNWFTEREKVLENLYTSSTLQYSPDEDKIKDLLLNCLESHYGNLEKCVVNVNKYEMAINKIKSIIEEIR
jgi:predicted nucleotidyltransferase